MVASARRAWSRRESLAEFTGVRFSSRVAQNVRLLMVHNLGALWLIVEFTSFFKPEIGALIRCWHGFWLVLAATGAGSIYRSWPSAKIEFPIPLTDSSFAIKFGDIFDGEGVVVIPVNEYFDGVLGKPVSKNSLHGKFIEDVLGGHSKIFFDLTRKELAKVKPKATEVIRTTGPNNQYEIGTVVQIDYNDKCYLLAVLSHTDLQTLKASATVDDLWICLTGVWNGIREHYSGGPARIPLFGSGLSGVGLLPEILTEIIITSFACHTKKVKVADKVTLVLPQRLRGKLYLKSFKRRWR